MSNKVIYWFTIAFIAIQVFSVSVSAVIGCAAEANFQGCKDIQEGLLKKCGPVDYTCQCSAQKLIRQCYDLCPEYSIDANERSRIADSICAAVPTSSALPLPSNSVVAKPASTWVPPTTTGTVAAPSAIESVKASSGLNNYPTVQFILIAIFVTMLMQ